MFILLRVSWLSVREPRGIYLYISLYIHTTQQIYIFLSFNTTSIANQPFIYLLFIIRSILPTIMYSSTSITNYFSSILNRTTTTATTNDSSKAQQQQHDSTPIPKSFIISTPEEKIIRINMKSVKLKPEESKAKGKATGGNGKDKDGDGAEVDAEDEDFISINKRQLTYAEVASIAVKLGKK